MSSYCSNDFIINTKQDQSVVDYLLSKPDGPSMDGRTVRIGSDTHPILIATISQVGKVLEDWSSHMYSFDQVQKKFPKCAATKAEFIKKMEQYPSVSKDLKYGDPIQVALAKSQQEYPDRERFQFHVLSPNSEHRLLIIKNMKWRPHYQISYQEAPSEKEKKTLQDRQNFQSNFSIKSKRDQAVVDVLFSKQDGSSMDGKTVELASNDSHPALIATVSQASKVLESCSHQVYSFDQVQKKFPKLSATKEQFIKDIKSYPFIPKDLKCVASVQAALTKSQKEHPDKKQFLFHSISPDSGEYSLVTITNVKWRARYQISYQEAPSDKTKKVAQSKVEKSCQDVSNEIPTEYQHRNAIYRLSPELIAGIEGGRGADHHISFALLQACLKQKHNSTIKKIKKYGKDQRFVHYFSIPPSGKVLNVIVDFSLQYQSKQKPFIFLALTAYFPRSLELRHRLYIKTTAAWDKWVELLPKIKDGGSS